jgi:hypothetical protein
MKNLFLVKDLIISNLIKSMMRDSTAEQLALSYGEVVENYNMLRMTDSKLTEQMAGLGDKVFSAVSKCYAVVPREQMGGRFHGIYGALEQIQSRTLSEIPRGKTTISKA